MAQTLHGTGQQMLYSLLADAHLLCRLAVAFAVALAEQQSLPLTIGQVVDGLPQSGLKKRPVLSLRVGYHSVEVLWLNVVAQRVVAAQ